MQKVRQVRGGMSDRDRRLYNFAKIKIAEEELDDCEITIDFQDQDPIILCEVNNPSGNLYVGYDEGYYPRMVWKKRGFWRNIKRIFVGCFSILKSALLDTLQKALTDGSAMKALSWI